MAFYYFSWTPAIPISNLSPWGTFVDDTNEQTECRAYSAKIELGKLKIKFLTSIG